MDKSLPPIMKVVEIDEIRPEYIGKRLTLTYKDHQGRDMTAAGKLASYTRTGDDYLEFWFEGGMTVFVDDFKNFRITMTTDLIDR